MSKIKERQLSLIEEILENDYIFKIKKTEEGFKYSTLGFKTLNVNCSNKYINDHLFDLFKNNCKSLYEELIHSNYDILTLKICETSNEDSLFYYNKNSDYKRFVFGKSSFGKVIEKNTLLFNVSTNKLEDEEELEFICELIDNQLQTDNECSLKIKKGIINGNTQVIMELGNKKVLITGKELVEKLCDKINEYETYTKNKRLTMESE